MKPGTRYYVKVNKEFIRIKGRKLIIKGLEWLELFTHEATWADDNPILRGKFRVSETRTGAMLSGSYAQHIANRSAENYLNSLDVERIKESTNKLIGRAGLSPRYKNTDIKYY